MNRLNEPIFMAGPKPMRTEFDIHQRLESYAKEPKLVAANVSNSQKFLLTRCVLSTIEIGAPLICITVFYLVAFLKHTLVYFH